MELFQDVSIIVVCCGETVYLERCIRSCLAQTFPGHSYEVLVVTAGFGSNEEETLDNYRQHIRVVRAEQAGVGETVRAGIRAARGRYLMLVAAEDFISDYAVLTQAIFLYDNSQYDGVAADYWLVEPNSDYKCERVAAADRPLLYGILYRKEVFLQEVLRNERFGQLDERAMLDAVQAHARLANLPIAFYRRRREA
ncbi:MAG TPA: glycosyltransferase [bacterium]|nr:glycosyltransferase [bacterium]